MSFIVRLILLVISLISSCSFPTFTDVNKTMQVISDVNIRDIPYYNGNIITTLKSGDKVEVISKCNETGWYKVNNGYISNYYLAEQAIIQETIAQPVIEQEIVNTKQQDYFEYWNTDPEYMGVFKYKDFHLQLYNSVTKYHDKEKGFILNYWHKNDYDHNISIGDHFYDGFEIIKSANIGDTCEVKLKSGTYFYKCVYINKQALNIDNQGLYTQDKELIREYDLVTYTCNDMGAKNVTVILWNAIGEKFKYEHNYFLDYSKDGYDYYKCKACLHQIIKQRND